MYNIQWVFSAAEGTAANAVGWGAKLPNQPLEGSGGYSIAIQ